MTTRRELIGTTLAAAWLPPTNSGPRLKRWWPQFPVPKEIWLTPFISSLEEGILLESAAGLLAREALKGGSGVPMIYEEVPSESYRIAFEAYCKSHSPRIVRLSLDQIIQHLHEKSIAKGFLLARFDESSRPLHDDATFNESTNVATSLAASTRGLVVTESLTERVERLGLKRIADVREETEAGCLTAHEAKFNRHLLGTCDPRARHARSLMIALGAFVCSARGDAYKRALARCHPDTPVLGWGCGPEDTQTIASSRAGLYQTATDWCHNLPFFAGETPGRDVPASRLKAPKPLHWSSLDWGDGNHYACLTMSDGDNVQWEMANFARGPEGASYYGHPQRGRIPFGWGINAPTLAQLAPRMLEDVLSRATPNDGFMLFGGAGYFYPDMYGTESGKETANALHAERLRGYMDLTGIRALAFNFQKWDSDAAMAACETMARKLPELEGIFAFQYYPYSAGEGSIRWIKGANGDEVPVASCSLCVWAKTGRPRDTTPAGVAKLLNGMPRLRAGAATHRCFSWALVHAWSRFRSTPATTIGADLLAEEKDVDQESYAPGTERGYSPALWTAERLEPHVKLVTPAEWLLRVRLRLRPHATMTRWLKECRKAGKSGTQLNTVEMALRSTNDSSIAARRCFELLKEVMS